MHRPIEARRHGIEIVHQDLALCDNLSAAANVFLGREIRKGVGPFKILDYAAMYRRAGQIFAELRSETRPRDLVRQMSGGQRQAVAIARTRIADAKIVLMDEPTAAISVRQVAEVLNLDPAAARSRHRASCSSAIACRMCSALPIASWCCAAAARWPTRTSPPVRRRK